MNLFNSKVDNYPDNGKSKSQNEYESFKINADWDENYRENKKKEILAKEVYNPNALLLRSLLEGTSFDRRVNTKKETPVTTNSSKNELKDNLDISFTQKISTIKIFPNKKWGKDTTFYKPTLRKKKFITEKEQNRLSHIVKKVLRPVKE